MLNVVLGARGANAGHPKRLFLNGLAFTSHSSSATSNGPCGRDYRPAKASPVKPYLDMEKNFLSVREASCRAIGTFFP